MTLDAKCIEATGPISKFQSPGIFIYIDLSISTLNFASGAPGDARARPNLGGFWVKNDDFSKMVRSTLPPLGAASKSVGGVDLAFSDL